MNLHNHNIVVWNATSDCAEWMGPVATFLMARDAQMYADWLDEQYPQSRYVVTSFYGSYING